MLSPLSRHRIPSNRGLTEIAIKPSHTHTHTVNLTVTIRHIFLSLAPFSLNPDRNTQICQRPSTETAPLNLALDKSTKQEKWLSKPYRQPTVPSSSPPNPPLPPSKRSQRRNQAPAAPSSASSPPACYPTRAASTTARAPSTNSPCPLSPAATPSDASRPWDPTPRR